MSLSKKVLLSLFLAAVAVTGLQAAPWFTHNSRRTPNTLVVVGNYRTPRLLADTIRVLSNQPYMLLAQDGKVFIRLPKVTVEVPLSKLDVYVNRLNPRRVVIIGDERFVPYEFETTLRSINIRRIPIVRIYGGNWKRIAEELDDLLNIGSLSREFSRNLEDMELRDPRLSSTGDISAPNAPAPVEQPLDNADNEDDAESPTPVEEPADK